MTPLMWCAQRQRPIQIMEELMVNNGTPIDLNLTNDVSTRKRKQIFVFARKQIILTNRMAILHCTSPQREVIYLLGSKYDASNVVYSKTAFYIRDYARISSLLFDTD